MSGAIDAAELAAFNTLDPGVNGADVYQHAPDNAPLPLVIIGDMEGFPIGPPGEPDRRVNVTIIVVTDGQERAPCTALSEQVVELLDNVTVAVAGYQVAFHFKSAGVVLTGDGAGYVGTIDFEAFALSD